MLHLIAVGKGNLCFTPLLYALIFLYPSLKIFEYLYKFFLFGQIFFHSFRVILCFHLFILREILQIFLSNVSLVVSYVELFLRTNIIAQRKEVRGNFPSDLERPLSTEVIGTGRNPQRLQ